VTGGEAPHIIEAHKVMESGLAGGKMTVSVT
jgi:hypothetical protein